MNTRDQFGNYLLLKKLAEDPLGETFRGGRVGRQGLERVVLLRVLNGQGFDAERVARAIQSRSSLAQAIKSPNIGQAIDVGQVRGVPYTAYDYSSGRSLAQLLEQSGRRNNPIPLDHALLVAERVALALAVAYETRFGDDRVQHGFVTPHLVHVSNEGELKLLGFEASTGLRESAAHPIVKQAVGRYLAPETLAGQPPSRADDVYSLGALLFEMLTGQQVPAYPPTGLAATIDQAVVAAEGSHLSPELAGMLKRTLCPRDQRIPDVVTWHKTLAKLMADGQLSPTTFNLAFYLHSLFRDEIDREGRELESEKAQAVSFAAAAPEPAPQVAAPAPVSAVRDSGPVRDDTGVLREEYGISEKKSGPPIGMILGGVAAVVVLGVAGYLIFGRGGSTSQPAATPPPQAAEPAPQPQAPAGPTPEELQTQIAKMVAEQSKQAEASLRAKYDEELKGLQQQLEDARKSRSVASQAPPVTIATTPRPAADNQAPAQEVPKVPAATTPAPAAGETKPAQQPAATPAPAPAQATPEPTPAPARQPAAAAPTPQAKPAVRVGDLVSAGPGVVAPRVTRQPQLRYPPLAMRLRKEATVVVRVLVDENGRSIDVQPTGGKAGYGMDEAALDFARGCQWEAARKDNVRVKMWTELKVAFKL